MSVDLLAPSQLIARIVETWRPLARHGDICETCGPVVAELRKVPDDPYPLFDRCCAEGQALFTLWTDAKVAFIDNAKFRTMRWGMAGLKGTPTEERAAALTALSPVAAADIWNTADAELREAKIRAVIAAWRSSQARPEPTPALVPMLECEGCGVLFQPRWPRQKYHDDACRARAWRNR